MERSQLPTCACRPLSGLRAKRPAQRASRPAVAQRVFNEQRRGGEDGICATAHMASCQHDNGCCALTMLHSSCVVANHHSHVHPSSPCPVAPRPLWSSCARVRKRDEIMSVHIGTQTLHKSTSGLAAGHCPLLCATASFSQGAHEYAVHAVAGTPRQPPHGEACQCIVETEVSCKGLTSGPNLHQGRAVCHQ